MKIERLLCLLSLSLIILSQAQAHLRSLQKDDDDKSTKYIVTLGDSYSSGLGIHRSNAAYDEEYGGNVIGKNGVAYKLTDDPGFCFRETDTTPGALYAGSIGDVEPVMLACARAEISHIASQFEYMLSEYEDEVSDDWEGSIILVSAGGNDIESFDGKDISKSLRNCVIEFNPFTDCNSVGKNQIANMDEVEEDLIKLYSRIVEGASKATIRVIGYPLPMQRQLGKDCSEIGWSSEEADWADYNIDELNKVIARVVQAIKKDSNVDIEFVSVYDYMTRGACESFGKSTHVNGLLLDLFGGYNGVSRSSFHPSQLGYNAIYSAILDSM